MIQSILKNSTIRLTVMGKNPQEAIDDERPPTKKKEEEFLCPTYPGDQKHCPATQYN